MSDQKDGSGAPENIEVIRDLLRKLEEVAAKDGERPIDDTAKAVAPRNDLTALQRTGTVPRPATIPLPEFPSRTPSDALTTIDRRAGRQVVVAEPAPGARGMVIAGLSFAFGIATAIGVIFVFDPLKRLVSPTQQASRTAPSAPSPAPVASPAPEPSPTQVAASPEQPRPAAEPTPAAEQPPASAQVGAEPSVNVTAVAPRDPAAIADQATIAVVPPAPAIVLPASPPRIEQPVEPPSAGVAAREIVPPQPAPAARAVSVSLPPRLSVRAGTRQSLGLRLDPAPDESTAMLIVIRNVPAWITLSKGSTLGNDIWVLPAHVADGLELVLADTADGATVLKVQIATRDGRILAEREIAVETRRDAAPSSAPMRAGDQPQGEQAVLRLLARGELLIDTGEIEAARTLLRSAAEAGSVQAALKLAETYDPAQLQKFGMGVASADPAQAVRWYERAEALGSREATARLAALGKR